MVAYLSRDDLYKVYVFARKVAKERCIKISRGAWGSFVKKAHPHYIVEYKDNNGNVVASINFEYKEDVCIDKCNSIW